MDKEKLQLRHISPYLPYGLRFRNGSDGILTIDGWYDDIVVADIPIDDEECEHAVSFEISDIDELILRPLSDLIKPLPSGEIPIIEMAKIVNTGYDDIDWDNAKIETKYNYSVIDEDYNLLFRFNTENMYFDMNEDGSGICGVPHTDKLFEYLFANMFDVFGLLEKGLAIDLNKVGI